MTVVKHLLTVREVSETLGLSRTTIYQLINSGELEAVRIGAARRVPADACHEYVARLRDEAAQDGNRQSVQE